VPDDSKRRKSIDDAIDNADNAKRKKKPAPRRENPFPPGSARHKLFKRRQIEKERQNQSTDSNQ